MSQSIERQKMPAQEALERIKNFDEVALGYTIEQADKEAQRCLSCRNAACRRGCPMDIDIKGFIQAIKDKDYLKGYTIIKQKNNLPGICGRVCPQESQCEKECILGLKDTPVSVGWQLCVIGAGNVAVDAARSALRLGAGEVTIVYRRTEKEMPARAEEIEHAKEEGGKLLLLTSPVRIIGDARGWVKAMECQKNELGVPDSSGRRRPVPLVGSEFTIPAQTIICAIGQGPNPLLLSSLPELKLNKHGNIIVDERLMCSIPGVFAGGDIVTGAATVIEAMAAGKKAAQSIDTYLT